MEAVKYICLGYLIGFGIVAIKILWCHFNDNKMESRRTKKIRKGI